MAEFTADTKACAELGYQWLRLRFVTPAELCLALTLAEDLQGPIGYWKVETHGIWLAGASSEPDKVQRWEFTPAPAHLDTTEFVDIVWVELKRLLEQDQFLELRIARRNIDTSDTISLVRADIPVCAVIVPPGAPE